MNWFGHINDATPIITIRDYDNYYSRKYHHFPNQQYSTRTVFSTRGDNGEMRYVRSAPHTPSDKEFKGRTELNLNFPKQSMDTLSVPNLVDHFQENLAPNTMNINDMSFTTFRNQEMVCTLNSMHDCLKMHSKI